MTIQHLGEFTIESGTIRITDPCYTKDTWCAGTVKAKNGVWEGEVILSDEGDWGMRVAHLRARLKSTRGVVVEPIQKLDIDVGVDSGQAGIFDDAKYPDGERTGEYGDLSTFYGKACAQTVDDETGKSRHGGVVDGFGYGDGGYTAYATFDGDEVIAIDIEFIGDGEDEDYEEDEE